MKVTSSCKGEIGLLEINKGARIQGGRFIRHENVKEDWTVCEGDKVMMMMGEGEGEGGWNAS
jgi:hypothetical protein